LESSAPNAVLPAITETVARALRLPYVAIAIDQGGICINAAATGQPVPDPLILPLVYQGETVGQLIVGPRGPSEPFSATDRRLLDDLARQAGVAAHAMRLTSELQQVAFDLQHSREQLVTMREKERRRLRRDLHDGLGPTLAGFSLTVGAVRNLLLRDPQAADALLVQLGTEAESGSGAVHEADEASVAHNIDRIAGPHSAPVRPRHPVHRRRSHRMRAGELQRLGVLGGHGGSWPGVARPGPDIVHVEDAYPLPGDIIPGLQRLIERKLGVAGGEDRRRRAVLGDRLAEDRRQVVRRGRRKHCGRVEDAHTELIIGDCTCHCSSC
jgi:hypothetical protein